LFQLIRAALMKACKAAYGIDKVFIVLATNTADTDCFKSIEAVMKQVVIRLQPSYIVGLG
jgi:hypothetical protein